MGRERPRVRPGMPVPRPGGVALVTGASSGLGREIARLLAERGHDLVVVARRRDRLEELAATLRHQCARRVEVCVCDVSDSASRAELLLHVEELSVDVDVLVLAAGFGMGGRFTAQDPERTQLMTRTNLEGVIALTGAFAPAMQRRRSGGILFVSSITGHQPTPNMAAYAATKAAVTSFAEALHEELRADRIAVTALCAGPMDTEFVDVAAMQRTARRTRGLFQDPAAVARAGVDALAENRRVIVPGFSARMLCAIGGRMPRPLWLPLCRCLMA